MVNFSNTNLDFTKEKGPIKIKMTNDYLFHILLQSNNIVLKALVAALLHLKPWQISSAIVQNPIIPGSSPASKIFYMDVIIYLNDSTIINIEMQVINEHNWPERSLSYLSRAFDNINRGATYTDVHPVIQIGILDFTLFEEHPEFYASYYLLNEKTYYKYSDKIRISVLDLSRRDLATEDDIAYELDLWASFFKAQTWEELISLTEKSDILKEAASTVCAISQNNLIRWECEERERFLKNQERIQHDLAQSKTERETLAAENKHLRSLLAEHGINFH